MRTTLTALVSEQLTELKQRIAYNKLNNLPTADLIWAQANLTDMKAEAIRNNCWEFRNDK